MSYSQTKQYKTKLMIIKNWHEWTRNSASRFSLHNIILITGTQLYNSRNRRLFVLAFALSMNLIGSFLSVNAKASAKRFISTNLHNIVEIRRNQLSDEMFSSIPLFPPLIVLLIWTLQMKKKQCSSIPRSLFSWYLNAFHFLPSTIMYSVW